jgi:ABC-2 type transport system permease protein
MKNLKIFFKLCEMNLKKLLVYRASFFISLLLMSMWVVAYFTLIEVIFTHTKSIAGWNKGGVLLIMSFYYLVQNIADIFFKDDFEHFGETFRRGELDFKLVKPVSPRLLSFFWEIRFDHAASLIPTFLLFIYAFQNLSEKITLPLFLGALFFTAVSLIFYFTILSFIATLTFWVHKNDTFNTLIFNVSQLARYPRQIYRHIIGKILTFGIPLALIASIPAETVLGFENSPLPMLFIAVTLIFYILGRIFWNLGLKKYTSAS